MIRALIVSVVMVGCAGTEQAFAWGCDGHQAVAMLAQRLLSPAAINAINATLKASPVDPAIKPYCTPLPQDPMADAATWADDYRVLNPDTGGWHFIDFPLILGSHPGDYKKYCPMGNCVIDAIVEQYRVLTTTADANAKGNALRFIIHFVGDIHQPLHTTSNGDRGGNCVPVTYFSDPPQEDDRHNWRPNLHSVWDEGIIRRLMMAKSLTGSRALADYVASQAPPRQVNARPPSTGRVLGWARDASTQARKVTYGKLPVAPPMESVAAAAALATCDENNHVGQRMAMLHEDLTASYEQASVPVVVDQLRLAAERLAATLKAAFPQ
jgi:hypothetical protein